MILLYTTGEFEYFHPITKRMIKTYNKIPFIVNFSGELEEPINQYLLVKTQNDWDAKSRTPINNAESIIHFLNFCSYINITWEKISSDEIKQFILFMNNNKNAESTIKSRISIIYSMYNWLEKMNYIKNNPFSDFSKSEYKIAINVFSNRQQYKTVKMLNIKKSIIKDIYIEDIPTVNEITSFYKFLPTEDRLMALLLIETGMRKEELLQLTVEMITEMTPTNSQKSYYLKLDAHKIKIKFNKSRYVMVNSSLRTKILKHLNSKEYKIKRNKFLLKNSSLTEQTSLVFISNRGNKFSTDKLNKAFEKSCKLSGYYEKHNNSIAPHQLRHFYASHFIFNKENDKANMESAYIFLSERLGHSSVETTKKYYVKMINKIKEQEDMEKYSEQFISQFLY